MPRAMPAEPVRREKPAAIYLPVISLRDGENNVTLFSRRGEVYTRHVEASAILRNLPDGKRSVAELVEHDDARRLSATLALGDVQEMLGRVPKIVALQARCPHHWRESILGGR